MMITTTIMTITNLLIIENSCQGCFIYTMEASVQDAREQMYMDAMVW